jgi:hypothetical protein
MSDIFKLILRAVIELFRSKASLEMEILTLRHQINVLRRNSTKCQLSQISIVWFLLPSIGWCRAL